jgi:glycosyltransferase involved in cell wall biosynthesis
MAHGVRILRIEHLGESIEKISIIIPTKNEAEIIGECLRSVFDQTLAPFEVLLVDGGSTDSTLEIAKGFGVKIIKEGKPSSPANARNIGAENASGNILLMMDADVVLQKDCLEKAVNIFRNSDAKCVIPSQLNCNHSYLEFIQRKWDEGIRTRATIGFQKANVPAYFLRKEVFDKVKFDTRYGFGEDDDFSLRLEQKYGQESIIVAPDCKVIAHLPHTVKELATRYIWWGRTFLFYLIKHFNLRSILNMGSLLLPTLLVLTFFTSLLYSVNVVPFIFLFSLFTGQLLFICIRSKSTCLFQFAFFGLIRSLFFVVGLLQVPLYMKRKGR